MGITKVGNCVSILSDFYETNAHKTKPVLSLHLYWVDLKFELNPFCLSIYVGLILNLTSRPYP